MNKNKRGSIRVTKEFLEDAFDQGVNIFEKCLIVRCEYLAMQDCFEYCFYSDLLEEVLEGQEIPRYTCHINVTREEFGIVEYKYEFVKLK